MKRIKRNLICAYDIKSLYAEIDIEKRKLALYRKAVRKLLNDQSDEPYTHIKDINTEYKRLLKGKKP